MGDIHVDLFPKECPKTVENFCVHARNGYFNGHIFHRVIKQFMVQTGEFCQSVKEGVKWTGLCRGPAGHGVGR